MHLKSCLRILAVMTALPAWSAEIPVAGQPWAATPKIPHIVDVRRVSSPEEASNLLKTVTFDATGTPHADSSKLYSFGSTQWTEQQRLIPTDPPSYRFGSQISASGNTAVVAAAATQTVYFMRREGLTWVNEGSRITNGRSFFGPSVAVDGSTAVVCPSGGGHSTRIMDCFVYERGPSGWQEQAVLRTEPQPGGYFTIVNTTETVVASISGDTILIGNDQGYRLNSQGAQEKHGEVFVFVRQGTSWSLQARIVPNDVGIGDGFGRTVEISGDLAVIGAPDRDSQAVANSGVVYVFRRTGQSWTEVARLAPDANGLNGFGSALALDGTRLAVLGAYSGADGAVKKSAWVYSLTGDTSQALATVSIDAAYTPWDAQWLDNRLAVGWAGNVGLFEPDQSGWRSLPVTRAPGAACAILTRTHSDLLCGTANFYNDSVAARGGIHIAQPSSNGFNFVGSHNLGEVAVGDAFGRAIAVGERYAVVGAPGDSFGSAYGEGSVYIYRIEQGRWHFDARLRSPGASQFGGGYSGLSIAGDQLLVGEPGISTIPSKITVFARSDGQWLPIQSIPIEARFHTIAADGDDLVVGMWGACRAQFYTRGANRQWSSNGETRLTGCNRSDGTVGVAIADSTAVVGGEGRVEVLSRDAAGRWAARQTLVAPQGLTDLAPNSFMPFGFSAALTADGAQLFVAAPAANVGGVAGVGRVVRYSRAATGAFVETGIIAPRSESENRLFGARLQAVGTRLFIGNGSLTPDVATKVIEVVSTDLSNVAERIGVVQQEGGVGEEFAAGDRRELAVYTSGACGFLNSESCGSVALTTEVPTTLDTLAQTQLFSDRVLLDLAFDWPWILVTSLPRDPNGNPDTSQPSRLQLLKVINGAVLETDRINVAGSVGRVSSGIALRGIHAAVPSGGSTLQVFRRSDAGRLEFAQELSGQRNLFGVGSVFAGGMLAFKTQDDSGVRLLEPIGSAFTPMPSIFPAAGAYSPGNFGASLAGDNDVLAVLFPYATPETGGLYLYQRQGSGVRFLDGIVVDRDSKQVAWGDSLVAVSSFSANPPMRIYPRVGTSLGAPVDLPFDGFQSVPNGLASFGHEVLFSVSEGPRLNREFSTGEVRSILKRGARWERGASLTLATPRDRAVFGYRLSGSSGSVAVGSRDGEIRVLKPRNESGWYWNPSESGRGFFIEYRGGNAFLAGFVYDDSGRATWFTCFGSAAESTFTAPMLRFRGGQTLSGPYVPPIPDGSFGNMSITFLSSGLARMTWPGGSTLVERIGLAPGSVIEAERVSTVPESGWWWNPAESGRGWAIETQGRALFGVGFLYDSQGNPVWYATQGELAAPDRYVGTWIEFAGGQTLTSPYRPAQLVNGNVGAVEWRFTDSSHGEMTVPGGRVFEIERLRF